LNALRFRPPRPTTRGSARAGGRRRSTACARSSSATTRPTSSAWTKTSRRAR